MNSAPITVRTLLSPEERELHLYWSDQAFPLPASPPSVLFWHRLVTTLPEYHADQMRGAFQNGEQVGGYIIYKRMLRVGAAQLATGCISALVTYPPYRHQGVATALTHDSVGYACSHDHALLLLDGIPNFYHRYGYTDVFDRTIQDIDCSAILAQPSSSYTVRPATQEDAEALLELYHCHYGNSIGSFTRTLEQETYWLAHRWPQNPLLLAISPTNHPKGYLSLASGPDRSQALELAADDWLATLALLQYHARLLQDAAGPSTLYYRLPLTSPILRWIIDHLEVPDTSHWGNPVDEWAVRSHSYHHHNAGWLARLVSLPTLAEAMLPEWQVRWRRSLAQWTGCISLRVGEEECIIDFNGDKIHLTEKPTKAVNIVNLSSQVLMQMIFGYRPGAWDRHAEDSVPDHVHSVLNILFPCGNTFIPISDGF